MLLRIISYFSLLLIYVFKPCFASAQNQQAIDSLNNAFQQSTGDQRIDILCELIYQYIDVNNEEALTYARKAKQFTREITDSARIVRINRLEAQILSRLTRYDEVIVVLNKISSIAERNNLRDELKFILNGLAVAFTYKADYHKALDYHLKSLKVREEDGKPQEIRVTLTNVGLVYYKMKNFETALNYYNRALKLYVSEEDDNYDLDRLYINMALCYKALSNFSEAIRLTKLGLEVCSPGCRTQIKVEGEFALGFALLGKGNLQQAESHLQESLRLSKEIGNTRFQAENLYCLGVISDTLKNYGKARSFLEKSEQLTSENGLQELELDVYRELNKVFKAQKDYKKLSEYQRKYIRLNEKIRSEARQDYLDKLQADFEEVENKKMIVSQQRIMLLQEEALEQKRLLNFVIACMVVLLTALTGLLFKSGSDKKKIGRLLDARIYERAQELKAKRESVVRSYNELSLFAKATASSMEDAIVKIKADQVKDHDPRLSKYLSGVSGIVEQLSGIVARLRRYSQEHEPIELKQD